MCNTAQITAGGPTNAPSITPPGTPSVAPTAAATDAPQLQQLATAIQNVTQALGALVNALGGASALTQPAATSTTPPPPPPPGTSSSPSVAGGGAPAKDPDTSAPPKKSSSHAPKPGGGASNARRGVLLIGDSLSVGTKPYLTKKLAGQPVKVDATGGISLAEGMRRYNATKHKPRVVEMALFTNNSPDQIGELRAALKKTVADARKRGGRVVWATIARPGNYGPANQLIREYAAKNPDVMRVVDWKKMVNAHPGYLDADKIHATPTGYKARARALADAAR